MSAQIPPRFVICLQFWQEDREKAYRLARLIAALLPAFRDDLEMKFVARFDCSHDKLVEEEVRGKMHTSFHRCRRRASGWPYGPNEMVHDLFMLFKSHHRFGPKGIKYFGAYLLEADNVPLRRDWLDTLIREWGEARAEGKMILGAWLPYGIGYDPVKNPTVDALTAMGHVNGNLIFLPEIAEHVSGLEGCHPRIGWDIYHAKGFSKLWKRSRYMRNIYNSRGLTLEGVRSEEDGERLAVVHGVKDDSLWDLAREVFLAEPV